MVPSTVDNNVVMSCVFSIPSVSEPYFPTSPSSNSYIDICIYVYDLSLIYKPQMVWGSGLMAIC